MHVKDVKFWKKDRKTPDTATCRAFLYDQVYKPGSVLTAIYLAPRLLAGSSRLLGTVGPTFTEVSKQCVCDRLDPSGSSTALLRIEFTALQCSHGAGGLLPHLFTMTGRSRLHLSVALVLGSPPAGVTRYPCPVEPGLSSSGAFRHPSAAVQPGRGCYCT